MSHIELRGVRVHNLQAIDLRLPLGQLIAITGVSGAGKSSLAVDTLVAEARRRYVETFAPAARQLLERIERPDADALEHLPPAVTLRPESSFGTHTTLGTLTEIDDLLRMLFARRGQAHCPRCNTPLTAHTPDEICRELTAWPDGSRCVIAFPSENTPAMLAQWRQLGFVRTIALLGKNSATPAGKNSLGIAVDRLIVGRSEPSRWLDSIEQAFAHGTGRCLVLREVPADSTSGAAVIDWEERRWQVHHFSRSLDCAACGVEFPALEPEVFDFGSSRGACLTCGGLGVMANESKTTAFQRCSDCDGSRLQPLGRGVRLGGTDSRSLVDLRESQLQDLAEFLAAVWSEWSDTDRTLVANLVDELQSRLRTLIELGLEHLALNRSPRSLSRGELQRARLAAALTTRLDNAMYVLDEPAAGLHPSEQPRVLAAIQRLQQAGNTVIVIEHQALFIAAAEEVVDLGPGAGREGGRIVFQGTPTALRECVDSVTGAFLRPRTMLAPAATLAAGGHANPMLRLEGATLHNLKSLSVEFPLEGLCVVAGVSGSGKSSLVQHTLWPALCQRWGRPCDLQPQGQWSSLTGGESLGDAAFLDSSPLRHSRQTNAATVLQTFGEIRRLFAETNEAKVKNFTARHFRLNAKDGGRCPRCRGQGLVEFDMQFLADLTVTCPECHGSRYERDLLDAKLRGLSIAEVLSLSADEAFTFFRGQPRLQRRLKCLKDVGLGYLPLGQAARTLSRGESQRLKLASFLANRSRTPTLFVMDEPASGLHPADVETLLSCLRRLIEVGHSLIVVEHHPALILAADWVIELGPGAGDAGGRVIAAGPPGGQASSPDNEG